MKAISILQPWAELVASGSKKIETRSWTTPYRGPILIHASKRFLEPQRVDNQLLVTDPAASGSER